MNFLQGYTLRRETIDFGATASCNYYETRAVLSQGGPRDAAVNFDKKNLQRHCAVSVPQHGFPVGL